MSLAEVNGQRIAYTDHGGSGPAIIFSHGFLMDASMFDAQVAALGGDYRCITWDQRGHGGTEATGPFTYWDSAEDALSLLTYLGIDQAVFAGMSQGGFIALRAALVAPERVRALVLIDSQAGLEDPNAVPLYEAMHAEWVANGPAGVQEAVAAIILGPGVDVDPWYDKWNALDRAALSLPFRTLMDRDDLTDRLAEIAQATLVLHGTDDAAISMGGAEQLCDGLAGCSGVVAVPHAGHAANVSQPEVVNAAIADFLATI